MEIKEFCPTMNPLTRWRPLSGTRGNHDDTGMVPPRDEMRCHPLWVHLSLLLFTLSTCRLACSLDKTSFCSLLSAIEPSRSYALSRGRPYDWPGKAYVGSPNTG